MVIKPPISTNLGPLAHSGSTVRSLCRPKRFVHSLSYQHLPIRKVKAAGRFFCGLSRCCVNAMLMKLDDKPNLLALSLRQSDKIPADKERDRVLTRSRGIEVLQDPKILRYESLEA